MRRFALGSIALLVLLPASGFALSVDKLLVFPTTSSIRVLATMHSNGDSDVSLRADIKRADNGDLLWEGSLGSIKLRGAEPAVFEKSIEGLKPALWSPGSPTLYTFTLRAQSKDGSPTSRAVRTGFRSVESRNGQILLNGRPVFLCGLAINPPGRGIPETTGFDPQFAHDYVKFMRSHHFNCIRINVEFSTDPRSQPWFDACDELGMMVYQGCYGSPPAGKGATHGDKNNPPDNLDASVAAYREVFETYAAHPSIIIYVLSNELPYGQKSPGPEWHQFLMAAWEKLRAWDNTHLYIGNAGYGEGKEGDINDVHRYWGWYYNSFLTYYNLRHTQDLYGDKGAVQPFTFSECVGSFTSSLGEFNLTFRKQLGAALEWTGHSPEQAKDALGYQAFMAGHACESFRTMREVNPRLAGLMPFTILFYNWNGITSFEQMKAKPVAEAMGRAYQPVLLSWEMWTPQVYAGQKLHAFAHIVNDAEDFSELSDAALHFRLSRAGDKDKGATSLNMPIPAVPYFGHLKLSVPLDAAPSTQGDFWLEESITQKGKAVSENQAPIFIADGKWREQFPRPRDSSPIPLYDPSGRTAKALDGLGIKTQGITDLAKLPPRGALIVGEEAASDQDLGAFVRVGGRVLLLAQDAAKFKPAWLPARVEMLTASANDPTYLRRERPTRDGMNINLERPDHPVFAGLDRSRFHLWSDYTHWDQTRPGFPVVYPVTHGFRLTRAEDLDRVAILANYDRGLEAVALCEMFDGKGSVIFTSFGLVSRAGLDPVADRMLANLVAYLTSDKHKRYPLIDAPIVWGRYATEKGVIAGPLNGLVENCRWVPPPTDPHARPLADNTGEWNTKPGEQFVSIGRRPYGPYGYNNGTAPVELTAGGSSRRGDASGARAAGGARGGSGSAASGDDADDPDVQGDAAAAAAHRAAERARARASRAEGSGAAGSARAPARRGARAAAPRVDIGTGFFDCALPPGRKAMVTQIQNTTKEPLDITISVNGREQSFTVPAGQTFSARSDLAGEARTAHVVYTGDKRLVLLETEFE